MPLLDIFHAMMGGKGGLKEPAKPGEIDTSHHDEHVRRGDQRAEAGDQAKDQANQELWQLQKAKEKARDSMAESQEAAIAGAALSRKNAPVASSTSSFKNFLISRPQQKQQSSSGATAPVPKKRHTPGHTL